MPGKIQSKAPIDTTYRDACKAFHDESPKIKVYLNEINTLTQRIQETAGRLANKDPSLTAEELYSLKQQYNLITLQIPEHKSPCTSLQKQVQAALDLAARVDDLKKKHNQVLMTIGELNPRIGQAVTKAIKEALEHTHRPGNQFSQELRQFLKDEKRLIQDLCKQVRKFNAVVDGKNAILTWIREYIDMLTTYIAGMTFPIMHDPKPIQSELTSL